MANKIHDIPSKEFSISMIFVLSPSFLKHNSIPWFLLN